MRPSRLGLGTETSVFSFPRTVLSPFARRQPYLQQRSPDLTNGQQEVLRC